MNDNILFFDLNNIDYLPLVQTVHNHGKTIILNPSKVRDVLQRNGIQLKKWEDYIPENVKQVIRKEMRRISSNLDNALPKKIMNDKFSSLFGNIIPAVGQKLFHQMSNMFSNEISVIETLDCLIDQENVKLIVMGCDNSHIQRTVVNFAKTKNIPTFQMAHGIYGIQLVRRAGEMENLFSDYIAVFGKKASEILYEMGIDSERIIITGAPQWDHLYRLREQIDQKTARKKMGLAIDKFVILFCASYADTSSAFFPAFFRRFYEIHQLLVQVIQELDQDIELIVRPHPMEYQRTNLSLDQKSWMDSAYIDWLKGKGIKHVCLIHDSKIESMLASDIIISIGSSSVIPETMILQRPVVVLNRLKQENPVYSDEEGVVHIKNDDSLSSTLSELITDINLRLNIVHRQNLALPELNYENDGRATQRVANLIYQMATDKTKPYFSKTTMITNTFERKKPQIGKVDKQPKQFKILEVVHDFPPNKTGGTELYTMNLAKELQKYGHDVTVLHGILSPEKPEYSFEYTSNNGIKIIKFNRYSKNKSFFSEYLNTEYDLPFRNFLNKSDYDIVHFQHIHGLSANWITIAKDLGFNVALKLDDFYFYCKRIHLSMRNGSHCSGPESIDKCFSCRYPSIENEKSEELYQDLSYRWKLLRRVFTLPDLVHTPSRFSKETHVKNNYINDNFQVIQTGILPFKVKNKLKSDDGKIHIAYLGAIDRRKGILNFLDAIRIFNDETKKKKLLANLRFEIYGNPVTDELFKIVMDGVNELENLEYKGRFTQDDRSDLFSKIDLLVLPSLGENYPFIIREAFYATVPVVATKIAGIPEIIHDGINGILYEPGDNKALASIFNQISHSPQMVKELRCKPEFIKTMSSEVKELTEEFQKIKFNKQSKETLCSIVIVTYNSAASIRQCLNSILSNTQIQIEVIIVDNHSSDETVSILREYEGQIKTIINEENKGFSFACNQGIRASFGKYVVLLNPDTMVTSGWLKKLIAHFDENVGAIGPLSDYVAGIQKFQRHLPENIDEEFSISELVDILNNNNSGKSIETKLLIGFCMVLPRKVLDEIGLLDENLFLGNDDLDLSWRLSLKGYKLLVVTNVFIHHKGQMSFKSEEKAKTEKLVQESTDYLYAKLEQHYGKGNVPSPRELWGMDWFKPTNATFRSIAQTTEVSLTSIIILTLNQLEHTKTCLESIEACTQEPHEIIIVDNGSTDGTIEYLRDYISNHENVKVIANSENKGFATGNNQGLSMAKGDFVLLLNNDTVVTKGWLRRMLQIFENNPDVGIVGPVSNYVFAQPQLVKDVAYRSLQEMKQFAKRWQKKHAGQIEMVHRVVGFCFLIKKTVIDKIGGLDERFGSGNFEDDDFCIRAAMQGFKSCIARDVFIHHSGSQTFKGQKIDYVKSMENNWRIFKNKWNIPIDLPMNEGYTVSLKSRDLSEYYISILEKSSMNNYEIQNDGKWLQEMRFEEKFDETEAGTVQLSKGEDLFYEGKTAEAEQIFVDILKENPDNPKARNNYACLLWQTNRIEDAAAEFRKAMEMAPDDRDVVWNSGQFLLSIGFAKEAKEIYYSYLSRHPKEKEIEDCLQKINELSTADTPEVS